MLQVTTDFNFKHLQPCLEFMISWWASSTGELENTKKYLQSKNDKCISSRVYLSKKKSEISYVHRITSSVQQLHTFMGTQKFKFNNKSFDSFQMLFLLLERRSSETTYILHVNETRTKQIGNLEFYVRSLTYDDE